MARKKKKKPRSHQASRKKKEYTRVNALGRKRIGAASYGVRVDGDTGWHFQANCWLEHSWSNRGQRSWFTDFTTQTLTNSFKKIDQAMSEKRCFIISDLSDEFHQHSRTNLLRTVTERSGCHEFCGLTDVYKAQTVGSALALLLGYWKEEVKFLNCCISNNSA